MRFLLSLVLLSALGMAPAPLWSGDAKEVAEVGVRALMQSPESYTNQVQVPGVVSQVAAASKIFGLIDLKEFETCQKVTCASLVLPVRWEGEMPEVGQKLTVTGRIRKKGDRYLFSASDLNIVPGD